MNLLLDNSSWVKESITFESDSSYLGNIFGGYAAFPTPSMEWQDAVPVGSRLAGTVNWGLELAPDGGEVWFVIVNEEGTVLLAEQMIPGDGTVEGTFTFDIPVTSTPTIAMSGTPLGTFPQINAYDQIGWFYLVPTPEVVDPVDPEEQNLPWWYCTPAEEPAPCPVRPTAFVPFSEYDTEFKYPLASSRVAKPVPKTAAGECQPCSPTLIECSEESNPEPVCGWVPISESGYGYQFLNYGEASLASMVDSVVSYVGDDTTSWGIDIHFVAPLVRVTCLEWSAEADGGNASFAWGMGSQYNVAVDPTTSFAPSPLEMQLAFFEGDHSNFGFYSPVSEGNPRSYSFLVEVFMCPDQ